MFPGDQDGTIIGNLEKINRQLVRQNSFGRIFSVGIIYGIGFFIGSAIIANEEAYLFAKLGRGLGIVPMEHQARI